MGKSFHRAMLSAVAIAAGLAFVQPASAQTEDAAASVRVTYADLNLQTHAGARAMLARLEAAAGRVCGNEPDIRDLARATPYQRCKAAALDAAVRQLDAPLVTAMARSRPNAVVLAGH